MKYLFLCAFGLTGCLDWAADTFGDHRPPEAEYVEFSKPATLVVEWEQPIATMSAHQTYAAAGPLLSDIPGQMASAEWRDEPAVYVYRVQPYLAAVGVLSGRYLTITGFDFGSCLRTIDLPGIALYEAGCSDWDAAFDDIIAPNRPGAITYATQMPAGAPANATVMHFGNALGGESAPLKRPQMQKGWKAVWYCPAGPARIPTDTFEPRECIPWAEAWVDPELFQCYGYDIDLTPVRRDCPFGAEPATFFNVTFDDATASAR